MSLAYPRPAGPSSPPEAAPRPRVRGESDYDRVSSLLMAVVLGAALAVAWLLVVYLTTEAYREPAAAPVRIIEVSGGGGSPEGELGSSESIDIPGAAAAEAASNNTIDASAFEPPSVQFTPGAVIDAVATESLAMADVEAPVLTGGPVAAGRRASKLGTGGPSLGFGPGDGGVRREERWSIIYRPGQTLDEYARQLDALGVELGTLLGNQMVYVRNFTSPTPSRRSTSSGVGENRLYFVWEGGARKQSDVDLLARAGVDVGDAPIFQFYPRGVEDALVRKEVAYKNRQPGEIRRTRFQVVPRGNAYDFEVIAQEYLR